MRPILIAALSGFLLAGPALAGEEGGYQKLGNLVVEMWDKNGNFHTMILQTQAYFPERPQLPKNVGDKIKLQLQAIPYEELKKPDSTDRIKEIIKNVLKDDPGSAKVEDVLIQKIFFQ